VDPQQLARWDGESNVRLSREGIPLAVLSGAEIALDRVVTIDKEVLRTLGLGGGNCLLIESPYARDAAFVEDALFVLELLEMRTMLAHPERAPIFQRSPDRVEKLVARGVLCCVNVGSIQGRFGRTAQGSAVELLRRGLVHAVASDSHDATRRPPGLRTRLDDAAGLVPGLQNMTEWLTSVGPSAILSGDPVPPPPRLAVARGSLWRRTLGRA
jgi:protein-tyrosine phosphatase